MRKIYTENSLKNSESNVTSEKSHEEPSRKVINNIMMFAKSYKTQKSTMIKKMEFIIN